MVGRGAQNLILLSRKGPRDDKTRVFLDELKGKGVRAWTPACDITQKDSLDAVLSDAERSLPPIRGCIQGSMVLRVSYATGA